MTDYLGGLVGQGSGAHVNGPGGFQPQSVITPSYRFGFDPAGHTLLQRGVGGTYSNDPTGLSPPQLEMSRRFPEFMASIDQMKSMAKPMSSLFRTAAMGQIDAAQATTLGNLRQQLAQRGLSGASFAQDTQSNIYAEYGLKRAQTELAAAQQEVDMTTKLTDFQNQIINQQLQREFQELQLSIGASTQFNQLNAMVQQMDMQASIANAQLQFAEWNQRMQQQGQLVGLGASMLTGMPMGGGGGGGGGGAGGGSGGIPFLGAGGMFGQLFGSSSSGQIGSLLNLFGPTQGSLKSGTSLGF